MQTYVKRCISFLLVMIMVLTNVIPASFVEAASASRQYSVVIENGENGRVSVNGENGNYIYTVTAGEEVSVSVTADDGYRVSKLSVVSNDGDKLVSATDGAERVFTMPYCDVTVKVQYKEFSAEDVNENADDEISAKEASEELKESDLPEVIAPDDVQVDISDKSEVDDSAVDLPENNGDIISTVNAGTNAPKNTSDNIVDMTFDNGVKAHLFNQNAKTLEDVTGVSHSDISKQLQSHINDDTYLGKSYEDLSNMEFIWSAIENAGGTRPTSGSILKYAKHNSLEFKTYEGNDLDAIMDAVLADAYETFSDIIVVENSDGIELAGFYVGNTFMNYGNSHYDVNTSYWMKDVEYDSVYKDPNYGKTLNRWWLSTPYITENAGVQTTSGNISTLVEIPKADIYKCTVIPFTMDFNYDEKGNPQEIILDPADENGDSIVMGFDSGWVDESVEDADGDTSIDTVYAEGNGTVEVYNETGELVGTATDGNPISITTDFNNGLNYETYTLKAHAEKKIEGVYVYGECIDSNLPEKDYTITYTFAGTPGENEYVFVFSGSDIDENILLTSSEETLDENEIDISLFTEFKPSAVLPYTTTDGYKGGNNKSTYDKLNTNGSPQVTYNSDGRHASYYTNNATKLCAGKATLTKSNGSATYWKGGTIRIDTMFSGSNPGYDGSIAPCNDHMLESGSANDLFPGLVGKSLYMARCTKSYDLAPTGSNKTEGDDDYADADDGTVGIYKIYWMDPNSTWTNGGSVSTANNLTRFLILFYPNGQCYTHNNRQVLLSTFYVKTSSIQTDTSAIHFEKEGDGGGEAWSLSTGYTEYDWESNLFGINATTNVGFILKDVTDDPWRTIDSPHEDKLWHPGDTKIVNSENHVNCLFRVIEYVYDSTHYSPRNAAAYDSTYGTTWQDTDTGAWTGVPYSYYTEVTADPNTTVTAHFVNAVKVSSIKFTKTFSDNGTGDTEPQTLENKVFKIMCRENNNIYWYVATDENGYAELSPFYIQRAYNVNPSLYNTTTMLPYVLEDNIYGVPSGFTFEIIEMNSPTGYQPGNVYYLQAPGNSLYNEANAGTIDNPSYKGGVLLEKVVYNDGDYTDEEEKLTEGAEFTVINRSAHAILNNPGNVNTNGTVEIGQPVATLQAKWIDGYLNDHLNTLFSEELKQLIKNGQYQWTVYDQTHRRDRKVEFVSRENAANNGFTIDGTPANAEACGQVHQQMLRSSGNTKLFAFFELVYYMYYGSLVELPKEESTDGQELEKELMLGYVCDIDRTMTEDEIKKHIYQKSNTVLAYTGNPYKSQSTPVFTMYYNGSNVAKTISASCLVGLSLPYGTYEIRESKQPTSRAYDINTEYKQTVQVRNAVVYSYTKENNAACEEGIRGGVELYKGLDGNERIQGNEKLENCVFYIYNISGRNRVVNNITYPSTSEAEALADTAGVSNAVVAKIPTKVKKDENGQTVYNDNGDPVYFAESGKILPYGEYIIVERKASVGTEVNTLWSSRININSKWKTEFDPKINADGIKIYDGNDRIDNDDTRGGIYIEKWDAELDQPVAQGDASLEGIHFQIINNSDKVVKYPDNEYGTYYEPGAVIMEIVTELDANGVPIAKTPSKKDLAYGDYLVQEVPYTENGEEKTDASGNKLANGSYLLTDGEAKPISITENDTYAHMYFTSDNNEEEAVYKNKPVRGGFKIKKVDAETTNGLAQGAADLEASFEVVNASRNAVLVTDDAGQKKLYQPDEVCYTFKTDKVTGGFTSRTDLLPYGTYIIRETGASKGYLKNLWGPDRAIDNWTKYELDGKWYVQFSVATNGTIVDLKSSCANPVKRGGVRIGKWDSQLNRSHPQGNADLSGIRFDIRCTDDKQVVVKDEDGQYQTYQPGEVCKSIYVFYDSEKDTYYAQSGAYDLPYGHYTIEEAPMEEDPLRANESYMLGATKKYPFTIENEGEIVTVDTSSKELIRKNAPVRGGFKIKKKDPETENGLAQGSGDLSAAFKVTNLSKNEVVVTNDTGTERTYNPGEVCYTFKTDKDGNFISRTDLLPYGSYRIEETGSSTGYLQNVWPADRTISNWTNYKLDGKWVVEFDILERGQIVDMTADPCANPVKRGGIYLEKWDYETNSPVPQGNADFEGIQFEIRSLNEQQVLVYDEEGNHKTYYKGDVVRTITMTYDEATDRYVAKTGQYDLPVGDYEVKEIPAKKDPQAANATYRFTDGTARQVTLTQEGVYVGNFMSGTQLIFKNKVNRGGFKMKKIDAETKDGSPQGDADLSARFKITNKSRHHVFVDGVDYGVDQACWYFTTDAKTGYYESAPNLLPVGTYILEEVDPSKGYLENIWPGERKAKNWTKYKLDGKWYIEFTIEEEGQMVDLTSNPCPNPVERGGIWLEKWDKDLHGSYAQGDGSLAGINFAIKNISNNPVEVPNEDGALVTYKPGEIVKTITTYWDTSASAYVANTALQDLPYGRYEVQEIPAEGTENDANETYRLTDGKPRTVEVKEENSYVYVDMDGNKLVFENEIKRGGFKMKKVDAETENGLAQGNANLAASFVIRNESSGSVKVNGITYESGKDCYWFESDAKTGRFESAIDLLPCGTYSIREEGTSTGYLQNLWPKDRETENWTPYTLDGKYMVEFKITKDGKLYDLETEPAANVVKRGGVQVWKYDSQLNASESQGGINHTASTDGTTLEGIAFTITNISNQQVVVGKVTYQPGDVVATIYTHWNEELNRYTAETAKDALPYGTYQIQESKTNYSYVLTDGEPRIFNISEEGDWITPYEDPDIVTEDEETAKAKSQLIFKNRPVRGDFKFTKLAEDTGKGLSVPFIVTNVTTRERHVIVTDGNGNFDSSLANADISRVNGNDGLLESYVPGKTTLDTEDYETNIPVWFGLGEDGSISEPDQTCGALIYGKYELEEMRCKNNLGYDLQKTEFYIHEDGTVEGLDDIIDLESQPELQTSALESRTGDHIGYADGEIVVVDKVYLSNLIIGKKYTVKGTIMDGSSGKAIRDGIMKVKGETTFVAEDTVQVVDVEFKFDAKKFAGKKLVVFEELYAGLFKLASHESMDDKNQTFYLPGLKTTAYDASVKDHVGVSNGLSDYTIVDHVSYTNLLPGKTYTLSGTLYDVETKEQFKDANGKIVTAETEFTAVEASGTVDLTFCFKADMTGKAVVVFEDVYYNGNKVATHADITDEEQSVYYPDLHTNATDVNTADHVGINGKTTILDKVSYSGLIPGKKYTVKGVLVDKETGKPIRKDGTVSDSFEKKEKNTPDKTDADIKATDVTTESVTEIKEATTENTKDRAEIISEEPTTEMTTENRTELDETDHPVTPEAATEAEASTQETATTEAATEKFDVDFAEHVGSGVTENDLSGFITAAVSFTADKPSGFVELKYEVDEKILEGKTTVVFENLYLDKKLLVTHEDLNDEAQTVYFPELHTSAVDGTTKTQTGVTGQTTIVDTVTYNNLIPGKEYTISGKLMNQKTGKEFKENGKTVTSSVTFKPEKVSGTVDLTYTLDASSLAGKTLVVFEDLLYKDVKVATHADIEDKAQSVHYPEIRTKAVDGQNQTHTGTLGTDSSIVDTVTYKNLVPGKEYTVKGVLMNKNTGKKLKINGQPVTAETSFTAAEENGSVDVTFTLDTSNLYGKQVVVFEDLYSNGQKVTSHADIEDKSQTVSYPGTNKITEWIQTGDKDILLILLLLTIGMGLLIGGMYIRKRKVNHL